MVSKTLRASSLVLLLIVTTVLAYSVKFKDKVTVYGGAVAMSQVIETSDVPSEVLEKIIVAYVPNGLTTKLDKRVLANLLRRHVKELEVDFGESSHVVVEARSEAQKDSGLEVPLTSEASAVEVALDALREHYPSETRFTLKSTSGKLTQHTSYSIAVSTSNRSAPTVRVSLRDKNRVVGTITFQFSAVLERKVAVADRKINKGEVVTPNDIKFATVNILSLNKSPVFEDNLPMVASKTYIKDEMLDMKYMEEVPTLLKGQFTKAISTVGGVTVTTIVQALDNGRVGNVVSVKNVSTGAVLKGTVLEDGTVLVLEVK